MPPFFQTWSVSYPPKALEIGPLPNAALFLTNDVLQSLGGAPLSQARMDALVKLLHSPNTPRRIDGPEGMLLAFHDGSALLARRQGDTLHLPATCMLGPRHPETWPGNTLHLALDLPWIPLPLRTEDPTYQTGAPVGIENLIGDPTTADAGTPRQRTMEGAMAWLWRDMPPLWDGIAFARAFDGRVVACSTFRSEPRLTPLRPEGAQHAIDRACAAADALFPGRLSVRRNLLARSGLWWAQARPFSICTRPTVPAPHTAHKRCADAAKLRATHPDVARALFS